jgi:hypothetical protein
MRKALLLTAVLAMALGITYLVLHKSGSGTDIPEKKDSPLTVNSNSSAFNRSFQTVLNSYYQLSDGFLTADTSMISAYAEKLSKSVDSIRFDQFKADSSVVQTAVSVAQSIPGEISGLIGEKTMEQKKREFNMISADLYSLIRVVRYDGSIIYHMSCATAFADSTAGDWLSASNKIVNPYLGKNDPAGKENQSACGELKDSLHFSASGGE